MYFDNRYKMFYVLILTCTILLTSVVISAGTLSGKLDTVPVFNENLTPLGNVDWGIWGYADFGTSTLLAPDVRKLGGSGISDLTSISNGNPLRGLGQFGYYQDSFAWDDGDTVSTETNAIGGIQHDNQPLGPSGVGEGFSFTVPADTVLRQVTVFTATHVGTAQFSASLSDSSAPDYVQVHGDSLTDNLSGIFTVDYAADSAGQELTIEFILLTESIDWSNAQIHAVTLSILGATPTLTPVLTSTHTSAATSTPTDTPTDTPRPTVTPKPTVTSTPTIVTTPHDIPLDNPPLILFLVMTVPFMVMIALRRF